MICPCGYDKECLPLHCGNGHNTGQCPPWPKDYQGITGTKSITVNTFNGDTELDKLLRLQQAIQVEVTDLASTNSEATTSPSNPPTLPPQNNKERV